MMPARRQTSALVFFSLAISSFSCGSSPKPLKMQPNLEDMVLVPEGEFIMGQDQGANEVDERPMHRVWLDAFYIDRTEVTNAQFKAFCDATNRIYPNNPYWDSDYFLGKPDHPVVNIIYEQARAYCEWASKRLPTEAEWEKAARGTDGRIYPWGNVWQEGLANLAGDNDGQDRFYRTSAVGSFPAGASPYGTVDMIGNVWEWVADWYDPSYYARSPQRNPLGPAEAMRERVVRGGSFSSPLSPTGDSTTHNRSKNAPNLPIDRLGCRCAWSATQP